MIHWTTDAEAWSHSSNEELQTMHGSDMKQDAMRRMDEKLAQGVRTFNTGATRDLDTSKPDYEGFLSPRVMVEFGKYMAKHRRQADGTLRDSDNWQKGIPLPVYMKSLFRHFMDLWQLHRIGRAIDHTGKPVTFQDTLMAIMFNVQGFAHEWLKAKDAKVTLSATENTFKGIPLQYDESLAGFEEKEAAVVKQRAVDQGRLVDLGCPDAVARQIVGGITYANWPNPGEMPYIYVAGPMRGKKDFNFPAFDRVRDQWVANGVNVISPADIDRVAGDEQSDNQAAFAFRDFYSIYFLKKQANPNNGVVFLDEWESSTGAFGEFGLARWLGLKLISERGAMTNLSFVKLTNAIMDTLVKDR